MQGRAWGFWTKEKLDILRRYLDAFTTAAKNRSNELLYFDLFAGETENYDRITWEPIEGSARIALKTSNPAFSRVRLFELGAKASDLERRLRADFPNRDLKVHAGDCNVTLPAALAELAPLNWAPAFAFIDPNGPDVHWTSLRSLAQFKRPGSTKVELWILFPHAMFTRLLSTGEEVRPGFGDRVTRMFGTQEWREIHRARVEAAITPADARSEYVNLLRWRLENELGYRWTHALEIFNERQRPLYDMIFATDHAAGNRIMSHLYDAAARELPAMRAAALELRRKLDEDSSGVLRLFEAEAPVESVEKDTLYQHLPPAQPFWRA